MISPSPDRTASATARRDGGFTLIELVVAVSLVGLLTTVLAGAIVVSLRTTPDTENRFDDARSTRALATWLSHDTTSAPRFRPLQEDQGGIDISTDDDAPDVCGTGAGENLLHLQWTETSFQKRTYVANYRFVVDDDEGEIHRYSCSAEHSGGKTGAFSAPNRRFLTSRLDPDQVPVVLAPVSSGEVASITFQLAGKSGETVAIETGSRNPADFFPS